MELGKCHSDQLVAAMQALQDIISSNPFGLSSSLFSNEHEDGSYITKLKKCAAELQAAVPHLAECATIKQKELQIEELDAESMIEKALMTHSQEIILQSIFVTTDIIQKTSWFTDIKIVETLLTNLFKHVIRFDRHNKSKRIHVEATLDVNGVLLKVTISGQEFGKGNFQTDQNRIEQLTGEGIESFLIKCALARLGVTIELDLKEKSNIVIRISMPNGKKN